MDHPGRAPVRDVRDAARDARRGRRGGGRAAARRAERDDRELRDFASTRLAPFKVPRKILILTEIPVGATGKLQRIGLAQKLGLS